MAQPSAGPPFQDIRMRGFRHRTDVETAVTLLRDRLLPLPSERVDLQEAGGRVLATDVVADVAVPSFNRAAMDGFALRGVETFGAGTYNPLTFEIVGASLPGKPFDAHVQPGQAVCIMTGAPMPEGADAVVPAENTEEQNGRRVLVTEPVPPGRHVGQRGEDIHLGNVAFQAGRRLRPQDLGVLASIGTATIDVVCRPAVAVLVTGDELLPCGSKPDGCRIVDSNSVMLQALIHRDGGTPIGTPIIPDRADTLRQALDACSADVILISGGTSVGQEDHAPRVLAAIGELCVHGVALRPASPTGIGFLGQRPVFLLPGNPVSCLCAYDLFAGPAIRLLGGRPMTLPYRCAALPMARKISSAVGRVDYVRVQIRDNQIEPLATSGASILSSTTRADGFVLVPRDSEGHAAGEVISVHLYDA